MKKYDVQLASLALLIVVSGMSNNAWTMEQQPIYDILAKKKVKEMVERQKAQQEQNKKDVDLAAKMGLVLSPFTYYEPIDSYKLYSDLLEKYKLYEVYLEEIRKSPELSSMASSLSTEINYAMTLEEMKQKIKATFSQMKKKGLMISKAEFANIKDKYYQHDKVHSGAHQDLSRIWGANFLREKINKNPYLSKNYDVPDYIIVLDDPQKISVDIKFPFKEVFPMVTRLHNGKIYFEKIAGDRVASWSNLTLVDDLGVKSNKYGIGYDDFSDQGNIIKQVGTNKYYIIDTESKNFKENMDERLKGVLEYAADKFRYLNLGEETSFTYEFDL